MRTLFTLTLSALFLAGIVAGCGDGGREVEVEVAPEHQQQQYDLPEDDDIRQLEQGGAPQP